MPLRGALGLLTVDIPASLLPAGVSSGAWSVMVGATPSCSSSEDLGDQTARPAKSRRAATVPSRPRGGRRSQLRGVRGNPSAAIRISVPHPHHGPHRNRHVRAVDARTNGRWGPSTAGPASRGALAAVAILRPRAASTSAARVSVYASTTHCSSRCRRVELTHRRRDGDVHDRRVVARRLLGWWRARRDAPGVELQERAGRS
jgi:hypothetical protein